MMDSERRDPGDFDRFVHMVRLLPPEVGFSLSRPMCPPGAPEVVNPYTCIVGMPHAQILDRAPSGDRYRNCEGVGATMYEALTRALSEAYAQRAITLRLSIDTALKEP